MTGRTAAKLFDRSVATLVRSWAYLASGSAGAEVIEADGATIAAFPGGLESRFLNNAVLERGLADLGATLDLVERIYGERGVERYALWVHESDAKVGHALEARGYAYDSSTRTMAMPLADLAEVDTAKLDLIDASLAEFWRIQGLDGLLPGLRADRARFYVSRFAGTEATTLMAFDHEGDCGIYMVGTVPAARRRGLGTVLSAHAVAEAAKRGCTTASLQATEMAEGVYAKVGFRDLGRFDEYVPAS